MQKIRFLGATIALGGLVLLTGCAVPGDPYYGGGYAGGGYSSGGYYTDPAPVVVQPAPVYINGGGYYGGRPYYDRPYYDRRPYYNNRPAYPYPGVRPGNYPRPPGVAVHPPLPVQGIGRPPQLPNVPGTPIRSTTNPPRDQ
ncbi:hypothetical protein [Variovorax sp. GB1P17]|uniref:hypothetical protein n=1 Tax=Variovorax sp. GB1P17 TaxID=3443740 RepID=UPI003F48DB45